MKRTWFHIIFWIFIALYVFDYIIDLYDIKYSIFYTIIETIIYATEFYVNLLFLLPFVLEKKGRIFYSIGLIFLFAITYIFVFKIGLSDALLSPNYSRAIVSFLLNNSLFIVISYFVWYFNKFELEKQKRLQLENEKLQSEMMHLKSQISPHFLFNALNNIYSLTLLKSDDAPKMLSALSDILRYFLYEGNKKEVFLESELEMISKYIQIQKFRQIPGMNNISLKISGKTLGIKVPPLIFMTLIENAFKHGDILENESGYVNIDVHSKENKIEFVVINSFQSKVKSDGIGLKNVKSQLEILFGNNYQMNITEENNSFNVTLGLNYGQ